MWVGGWKVSLCGIEGRGKDGNTCAGKDHKIVTRAHGAHTLLDCLGWGGWEGGVEGEGERRGGCEYVCGGSGVFALLQMRNSR